MFIKIIAFVMTISMTISLPSTFDLRYQPSAFSANYAAESQSVCQAFTWSNRLAQIIGNAYSLVNKKKIRISGRNIAECLGQSMTDMCMETSEQNILQAIQYLKKNYALQQSCQSNRYLERKGQFCRLQCDNGDSPINKIYVNFTEQQKLSNIVEKIGQGNYSAFAIVKIYDRMKYYSSQHQQHLVSQGDFYGYTVGQIVGWKNKGKTVTIKLGGPGWGFKGYANLLVDSPLISKIYSVFFDKNRPRPGDSKTIISID